MRALRQTSNKSTEEGFWKFMDVIYASRRRSLRRLAEKENDRWEFLVRHVGPCMGQAEEAGADWPSPFGPCTPRKAAGSAGTWSHSLSQVQSKQAVKSRCLKAWRSSRHFFSDMVSISATTRRNQICGGCSGGGVLAPCKSQRRPNRRMCLVRQRLRAGALSSCKELQNPPHPRWSSPHKRIFKSKRRNKRF